MNILTANPAEDPRRQVRDGWSSAMDTVRVADQAAHRAYARRKAAAQAVVTDADFDAISNFLKGQQTA